jgi:hypothetical protein
MTRLIEGNRCFDFIPEFWSSLLEYGMKAMLDELNVTKALLRTMASYIQNDQVCFVLSYFYTLIN